MSILIQLFSILISDYYKIVIRNFLSAVWEMHMLNYIIIKWLFIYLSLQKIWLLHDALLRNNKIFNIVLPAFKDNGGNNINDLYTDLFLMVPIMTDRSSNLTSSIQYEYNIKENFILHLIQLKLIES